MREIGFEVAKKEFTDRSDRVIERVIGRGVERETACGVWFRFGFPDKMRRFRGLSSPQTSRNK